MNQAPGKPQHYLLVTHSEWTSWVDLEHLRINPKRIVEWKGDVSALINLERILFNDYAPHVNLLMLDAYLIVEIDTTVSSKDIYLAKSSHKIYPYSSCNKLIPFDERSRQILYSESSRRQIEINFPEFEQIITPLLRGMMAKRDLAIAIKGYESVSKSKLTPKERKYWTAIFDHYHLGETQVEPKSSGSISHIVINKLLSIDPNSMESLSRFHSCKRLWALDLLIRFLESLKLDDSESISYVNNMKSLLNKVIPDSTNLESILRFSKSYKKILTIHPLPDFWVVYPYFLARIKQGDDEMRYTYLRESFEILSSSKKNLLFFFLIALNSEPHKLTALIREILQGHPEESLVETASTTPPPGELRQITIDSTGVRAGVINTNLDIPTANPQDIQNELPVNNLDNSPTADQIIQQNNHSRENEVPMEPRKFEEQRLDM